MKITPFSVAMFSLYVNVWTAVRTPKTTCSPFNGNEASCKAAKCHWCPCTQLCVPIPMKYTCDVGCTGFCGEMETCASHGCIYDHTRGQCYDLAIDTVDFNQICSEGKCEKKACAAKGCTFCKRNGTCVAPNMSLDCDPGCVTFCDNKEECLAQGCIYDDVSGECQPGGDRRHGYSMNICTDKSKTINGIYYTKMDRSKVRDFGRPNWCFCNPGIVSGLAERELYECELAAREMEIDIPIRDAGSLQLGIHLAEIDHAKGRKQTIRLNGVVVRNEFAFDAIGLAGTPHVVKVKFDVNCNRTEATIAGTKVPIPNRNMVLYLKSIPQWVGDPIDATIHGYNLEKLDV